MNRLNLNPEMSAENLTGVAYFGGLSGARVETHTTNGFSGWKCESWVPRAAANGKPYHNEDGTPSGEGWEITTLKRGKLITCTAQFGKRDGTWFKFDPIEHPSERLSSGHMNARATEKVVQAIHADGLREFFTETAGTYDVNKEAQA